MNSGWGINSRKITRKSSKSSTRLNTEKTRDTPPKYHKLKSYKSFNKLKIYRKTAKGKPKF